MLYLSADSSSSHYCRHDYYYYNTMVVVVVVVVVVVSPLPPPPYLERTSGERVEIPCLVVVPTPVVFYPNGDRHVLFDAFRLCEKLVE